MPAAQIWLRASAGRAAATLDLFLWGIFLCGVRKQKLAARIGIAATMIALAGMTLLWLAVSTNAASVVKSDITD